MATSKNIAGFPPAEHSAEDHSPQEEGRVSHGGPGLPHDQRRAHEVSVRVLRVCFLVSAG